jgi:hypothetical protein
MITCHEAPPYEHLSDEQCGQNQELKRLFSRGPAYIFATKELVQIIGPLTVAQRWYLAPEIGLSTVQGKIDWEGSAESVASRIVGITTDWGYPDILQLADFVVRTGNEAGRKIEDVDIDTKVRKILVEIFQKGY